MKKKIFLGFCFFVVHAIITTTFLLIVFSFSMNYFDNPNADVSYFLKYLKYFSNILLFPGTTLWEYFGKKYDLIFFVINSVIWAICFISAYSAVQRIRNTNSSKKL